MKKNIVKEFSKKKKKEFRIIETIYS